MKLLKPKMSQLDDSMYLSSLISSEFSKLIFSDDNWRVSSELSPQTESISKLTVVAQSLTLNHLSNIQKALSEVMNIMGWASHPLSDKAYQMAFVAEAQLINDGQLSETLSSISKQFQIEIGFQTTQPKLLAPGLLVMDMDSTVIGIECIDEIAKLAGLGEQVAEVTERAMRGELAFNESLISRVACLKGVELAQLQTIRNSLPLMPGLSKLIHTLKTNNWKIAIASGGFTYFADHLATRLGLDDAFANTLAQTDSCLTGEVVGDIVDADKKAQIVNSLAEKWGVPASQTVAMGDGANDLKMMEVAALGCAFHAKPVVNSKADVCVRYSGLDSMLYFLDAN